MPQLFQQSHDEANLTRLLSGLLALSDQPSAVMSELGHIVSCNSGWPGAFIPSAPGQSTLRQSLAGYRGVDELVDAIHAGSRTGSETASGVVEIFSDDNRASPYAAHWKHYASAHGAAGYTVLVLKLKRSDANAGLRADRLIVRQALIEEAERSRIGRALHDVVAQDLAWIRSEYAADARGDVDQTACTKTIDKLIKRVRTLSFELSPMVLTDLGVIAALHWLGDHIEERYDADIHIVDDGKEPHFSDETKTIVYRCIRELAINAAKHSLGAEIIVSCMSTPAETVIRVRDYGPGFDTNRVRSANDEHAGFGLISVEQQLHAIGARFDLVSELNSGTRATIQVPLRPRKDGN